VDGAEVVWLRRYTEQALEHRLAKTSLFLPLQHNSDQDNLT
jgi:hypothetical protein